MTKSTKQSILISYVIGLPMGLLFLGAVMFLPALLYKEEPPNLRILVPYGKAIFGLVIAFIIVLWFGGVLAEKSIRKGSSVLMTSFKFSVVVNLTVWAVFSIIAFFNKDKGYVFLMLPFIAFIGCTVLTTITIGFFIAYRIKRIVLESSNE